MNTTVQLIVSKCVQDRIYGERLVDIYYPNVGEALHVGELLRDKGYSVVVRPTYNEQDSKGRYFREWRSFNGSALKECRWVY